MGKRFGSIEIGQQPEFTQYTKLGFTKSENIPTEKVFEFYLKLGIFHYSEKSRKVEGSPKINDLPSFGWF